MYTLAVDSLICKITLRLAVGPGAVPRPCHGAAADCGGAVTRRPAALSASTTVAGSGCQVLTRMTAACGTDSESMIVRMAGAMIVATAVWHSVRPGPRRAPESHEFAGPVSRVTLGRALRCRRALSHQHGERQHGARRRKIHRVQSAGSGRPDSG